MSFYFCYMNINNSANYYNETSAHYVGENEVRWPGPSINTALTIDGFNEMCVSIYLSIYLSLSLYIYIYIHIYTYIYTIARTAEIIIVKGRRIIIEGIQIKLGYSDIIITFISDK